MSIAYYKIMLGYDFNQPFNSNLNKQHVKYWFEYEGCCVRSFVKNDDLFMVVFIKESNTFKTLKYASNSSWSYSKHASFVDAPVEIISLYNTYCENKRRKKKAIELIELRRIELKAVNKHNISIKNLRKLLLNHGAMYYDKCLIILNSIMRNTAKKSLRSILLNYLNDNTNKVTPFTYGQWRLVQQMF